MNSGEGERGGRVDGGGEGKRFFFSSFKALFASFASFFSNFSRFRRALSDSSVEVEVEGRGSKVGSRVVVLAEVKEGAAPVPLVEIVVVETMAEVPRGGATGQPSFEGGAMARAGVM